MTALPYSDEARSTFAAFADDYDLFTAHHDYDDWTSTLERLAREHGLRGSRLLDVACGTGKSLLPFLRRGYAVTACDISPEMLAHAARKVGAGARLEVHDMRALPVLGEFDLVACIDDGLNYLLSTDELRAAVAGLARNLAAGGVVLFDVNTVRSYRTFYGELHVIQSDGRVIVWDGQTPPSFDVGDAALARVDTLARDEDGTWCRERTLHHQRHFSRDVIEQAIADAGLRCVGVYGMQFDGSTEPGFGEHDNSKAIYVARHA
jgi:SAM-dependent methyltransferase